MSFRDFFFIDFDLSGSDGFENHHQRNIRMWTKIFTQKSIQTLIRCIGIDNYFVCYSYSHCSYHLRLSDFLYRKKRKTQEKSRFSFYKTILILLIDICLFVVYKENPSKPEKRMHSASVKEVET